MIYRVLESVGDLEAAVALEIAVWGLAPLDAAPTNVLRALGHAGGAVIGAYDHERLIGMSLCFPARSGGRWILWSHLTGVHRDYQGQNVGFGLKAYQRHWALMNGFDEMRWTFDPLQRGNANFNMHRLGATANQYHIDFYGVMEDEINQSSLPSDRIEAVWLLRDAEVVARLSNLFSPAPDVPYLLEDRGAPVAATLDEAQPAYRVQIPASLKNLPAPDALAWRLALRENLTSAFAHGYTAVDFTAANAYLLRRHPETPR